MREERKQPRWSQLKVIIKKMREGGWFSPKDLESELEIPDTTVDHDLKLGVHIGIFKQREERGPYAWIEYQPEEEGINRSLKLLFPIFISDIEKGGSPHLNEFINDIIESSAILSGKDPQDTNFRKLVYKIVKECFDNPEKYIEPELIIRFKKAIEIDRKNLKG
jgi:hypothetical protein